MMNSHRIRLCAIPLLLIFIGSVVFEVLPSHAYSPERSSTDAILLMVSSYSISFDESDEWSHQPGSLKPLSMTSPSPFIASRWTNEAHRLMQFYQELCTDIRSKVIKDEIAIDKCVTEKTISTVCGPVIQRLKKQGDQLARQRRRRRNPLRQFFRRLDPSRINLRKFGRWLKDEVLKDAVLQMVTGGVPLKGKILRRILRKTFIHKLKRTVILPFTRDLSRAGLPPALLKKAGLPEVRKDVLSRAPVVQQVDFSAFLDQCEKEEERKKACEELSKALKTQPDEDNSFDDDPDCTEFQSKQVDKPQETTNQIRGTQENYRARMDWDGFGGDVAPELYWCEAMTIGLDLDEFAFELIIDPDTGNVSGNVQGSGTQKGNVNQNPSTMYGAVKSNNVEGSASAQENGHWDIIGTAALALDYHYDAVCIGDAEVIGQALDHDMSFDVQAKIRGNTKDGVCVYWENEIPGSQRLQSVYIWEREQPRTMCTP